MRQVAETGPYMHNGSITSLEAVIEFYNAGGGDDSGKAAQLRSLHLTGEEKADLLAFLHSLTGTLPKVSSRPPGF